MSRKTVVYTKTGDQGMTSLVDGTRKKKNDFRIEVYGTLDELNSWIGMVRSALPFSVDILHCVQLELFNLGSLIACPSNQRAPLKLQAIDGKIASALEQSIDEMDEELPALKNFILPAGNEAATRCHVARTVCRRLERLMITFEEHEPGEVPQNGLIFINRLSDYLFVLSRLINIRQGESEVVWSSR